MNSYIIQFDLPSGKTYKAVYMGHDANEARNKFLTEHKGEGVSNVIAEPVVKEEEKKNAKTQGN